MEKPATSDPSAAGRKSPKVRWDDTNMKSSYANVCNVSSTREEVVVAFGINQAWQQEMNEVTVELTSRIILSPFAAKRLAALMNNVVKEYESRFGALQEPPNKTSPQLPSR